MLKASVISHFLVRSKLDEEVSHLNSCHCDVPCEYEHKRKPKQEHVHLERYKQWVQMGANNK